MCLHTFDGPVYIGALHVKLTGVVLLHVLGSFEELCPVFVMEELAEDIVHVLALQSQFSIFLLLG